nr:hypothetical protein [Brucella anthropi]
MIGHQLDYPFEPSSRFRNHIGIKALGFCLDNLRSKERYICEIFDQCNPYCSPENPERKIIVLMSDTLEKFLSGEMNIPFSWGVSDCASTADRWIKLQTGLSPLAQAGLIYRDEYEATAILIKRGGFPIIVNRAMKLVGFEKTEAPQTGDVGLIIRSGRMCLAIRTETLWFSRDESGLIGAPLSAVWKAWRIKCQ